MKLNPCTAAKHKWAFVKNKERVQHHGPSSISVSLRGVYKCEHCNQAKWGNFRRNDDQ